ncbi:MAG: DUF4179 domain-containing protein [Anaerolineae bacterium]
MDERQFQQLFKQTLEQEITNVELWKQIEGKLPTPSARTMHRGLNLGKAVLIALMLTVTALTAYAFYQEIALPGDPGITSVDQADLITRIDETQSLGGDNQVSVTLEYAYADANRITIGYTVSGVSPDGRRMMAYSNPMLTTGSGEPVDRLLALATQEDQQQDAQGEAQGFSSSLTTNFITPDLGLSEGDLVDLNLAVDVALSYLDNGEFPAPSMVMAGQANFTFSVPFISGTVIEIDQTADAAQPSVTLQQVSLTPSMTRLDMCYELPPVDAVPGWSPFVIVSIDDEMLFSGQTETYGLEDRYDLNSPCKGVIIPISLQGHTGAWRVEITEFHDLGAFSEPIIGPWAFDFEVAN